jgi:hypothetical protein
MLRIGRGRGHDAANGKDRRAAVTKIVHGRLAIIGLLVIATACSCESGRCADFKLSESRKRDHIVP